MKTIDFCIPGHPVAKGRGRFSRHDNEVRVHTPIKTVRYENLVRLAAGVAMNGTEPMDCPLELTVAIFLPIPQSWSKKKQEGAREGRVGATKRPDADNILKALKDGMNGVVYVDDARVTDVILTKRYAASPRVEVQVRELDKELA